MLNQVKLPSTTVQPERSKTEMIEIPGLALPEKTDDPHIIESTATQG